MTKMNAHILLTQFGVIDLLNKGISRDDIFFQVTEDLPMTKSDQQKVVDVIAQMDTMNVFATGIIPQKRSQ
tara:strand:+ start:446 stop:658 length:213 start_codon:yes stop_codon:yes gene_type:complete